MIAKGSQTVTFNPPSSLVRVGGGTPTLSATGGASGQSGHLHHRRHLHGRGVLSGRLSVLTYTGVGNCIIDANQAGSANYNAALQVQKTISVGLTITSDKYSATGPVLTFSGTGATGANAVTVTVCSVNVFPCTFFNRVSRVLTGTSPTNPWTTAATSALTYGTTYFAQATQAGQTSLVFTFTPTQPAPTDVALANGGTAQKADSGDTATITFNEQLNAVTICSAWINSEIPKRCRMPRSLLRVAPPIPSLRHRQPAEGGNFGTVYNGFGEKLRDGHGDLHELDDRMESEQLDGYIHARNPGHRWSQRGHQRHGWNPGIRVECRRDGPLRLPSLHDTTYVWERKWFLDSVLRTLRRRSRLGVAV